jgi:hypothetical protein
MMLLKPTSDRYLEVPINKVASLLHPFCDSADSVLAPHATKFLETLAKRLTEKHNT